MDDQQKTKIKNYVKILNKNIVDDDLLDFVIDVTIDRVLLHLNQDKVDPRINRVVAQVVVGSFNKMNKEANNTGSQEREIRSISDNGQSITYSDKVKSYMATAEDDELFSGFEKLLKPYRRVRVIAG